ncbi:MAG: peptidyl-prolyl cis-trans isomerase [Deltaproteobacteria bacterium]|nr:peptidyl-prolyl cis-trans isomerase [Deltaproteobacteria bacterium]MCB9489526.1 peptidyl-prolyl cis-trans isomerase [Deltaproteobacteria bacterium]
MNKAVVASIVAIALTLALILTPAGTARAEIINRIAAVVDEEVITTFEVEAAAAGSIRAVLNSDDAEDVKKKRICNLKSEAMRAIIEQKLLEREVARLGIPIEDQDVDARLEKILSLNNMSRDDLSRQLAREGKTMDEFRDQIRKQILTEQYVRFRLREKVDVTEEDARAYYQQHQDQYVADTRVSLREIRFNVPALATDAETKAIFDKAAATYESLLAGADFEQTARSVSNGSSAIKGGYLGTFLLDSELKRDYRRAVADLAPGQISTVFRDTAGFFILKVEDRSAEGTKAFEDVRDQIGMELRRDYSEREMRKLKAELYKKSFVDIKVEDFCAEPTL